MFYLFKKITLHRVVEHLKNKCGFTKSIDNNKRDVTLLKYGNLQLLLTIFKESQGVSFMVHIVQYNYIFSNIRFDCPLITIFFYINFIEDIEIEISNSMDLSFFRYF